jgi:hypothetical protein
MRWNGDCFPSLHQGSTGLDAWLNLGFRPRPQVASAEAPVLAQPDRRNTVGTCQAEGCLRVNAEKIRGLDGCQEWLPDTLDLNVV